MKRKGIARAAGAILGLVLCAATAQADVVTYSEIIRDARKLSIVYRDEDGAETERVVRPVGLVYHINVTLLAAWCELRRGFRHFRTDRIWGCQPLEDRFEGESDDLRRAWLTENGWDDPARVDPPRAQG